MVIPIVCDLHEAIHYPPLELQLIPDSRIPAILD